jgi:hypothetical protein
MALSATAAWRMSAAPAPLAMTATAVAVVNVASGIAAFLIERRWAARPRAVVALQHVTTALAGFFLFVSFAAA